MCSQPKINYIIVLILLTFLSYGHCKSKEGAYLVPNRIISQVGGSYTLMLKHDSVTPAKCYIERQIDANTTQKFSIDLFQQGQAPTPVSGIYDEFNTDRDVITSLGDGICGFKMVAVSKETTPKWHMSFKDKNEVEYKNSALVTLIPTHSRRIVEYKKVGDTLSINCAAESFGDAVRDLYYCEIINPQNERIKWDPKWNHVKDCYYTVAPSKMSDFGTWKCLQNFNFNMEPTEIIYEFIPIETNIIVVNSSLTPSKLEISCSVLNATITYVNYCMVTRPDGREIPFIAGVATERYTTIGTDIEKYTCTLQVELPLLEEEKGLWRCALMHTNSMEYGAVGGFLNVSREESKYNPAPAIPSHVKLIVNSTMEVECRIPRSTSYCWFRNPKGFLYPHASNSNNTLGICYLKKHDMQFEDTGNWTCGFGNQIGEPDEVYQFNVSVLDHEPLTPKQPEVTSFTTGTIELGCTSVGDYAIDYCRFLSPSGRMYHVDTIGASSNRILYSGKGLKNGDCTITLRGVEAEDEGTWSCITMVKEGISSSDEVYTNIHLTIDDSLSIASTLGIAFGAGFIFIITTVLLLRRFVKRRSYADVIFTQPISNQLNNDQVLDLEDNNINSVSSRNYNTTEVGTRNADENLSSASETENNIVFDLVDARRND